MLADVSVGYPTMHNFLNVYNSTLWMKLCSIDFGQHYKHY